MISKIVLIIFAQIILHKKLIIRTKWLEWTISFLHRCDINLNIGSMSASLNTIIFWSEHGIKKYLARGMKKLRKSGAPRA